jgi:galactokinase
MPTRTFAEVFGEAGEAVADAPGRVNLLGEHTDYNDGYVLPIAIAQRTTVTLRRRPGEEFALYSSRFGRRLAFSLAQAPAEHFASYVYGCLVEARAAGVRLPALDIHVHSDVPMGVGLSSSAALEVATLRALRRLLGLALDDVRIAQLAQAAEIRHAGVACGIMDQMASSLAGTTQALFLDTRTLARQLIALPADSAVLVLDSGVPRSLAQSGYNERRAQCAAAARLLGLGALRDVDDAATLTALPDLLRRRARHVVSENARVLQAIAGANASAFGALMNASHASLRDDYDVSLTALDTLVALLQAAPGVYGARLTGAGFGGACVALCRPHGLAKIAADVLEAYARQGFSGRQLVP